MKNEILEWIRSMIVCSGILSFLLFVSPDDRKNGVLEIGCSCVMFLIFLLPISHINLDSFYLSFSEYCKDIAAQNLTFVNNSNELHKEIIENEYAEYILIVADSQNIQLNEVDVTVIQDENMNWIPYEIVYERSENIPMSFKNYIFEHLGVPTERQMIQ